jgi:signal transduction histidine kinase
MTEPTPNVLVVDDSPESLDLVKQVLGADYKVRVAISGEAGLKLARQAPPDIILLDVLMPGMDGYEVCRQLKADPALADVPVIFITAMDEVEDEERGFSVGAVDYITKPISPPLVKARVATHLKLLHQRRQLEAALVRAEDGARAKAEFLAMMSHEIRTPLSGILGMVQLMMDTRLDDEQDGYMQTVQHSGEALLAILDDVLDFSKIEAGKLTIDRVPFDLRRAVESVVTLMDSRAREKSLSLVLDVAPDLWPTVMGDPLRLRQVLLNLVSNAIKFTAAGVVTVEVSRAAGSFDRLAFRISDTGMGIDEAVLPTLFADFAQQDASISRRFGGTGLGLSICKRLVALMGGSIEATSRLGSGSAFRFELPLPQAAAAVAGKTESGLPNEAPLDILVAEDNPVNQRIAMAMLTHRGHRVTVVADGAAAVQAVADGRFDLVMMDVRMPGVDGLEATRRIRRLPGPQARTPVIALTGMAFEVDRERCLAAEMNDVVVKPYTRSRLVDAIHRVTGLGTPPS